MKTFKIVCLTLILLLIHNNVEAQNNSRIYQKDIKTLTGSWEGTLTYLDYTSGKPFTMQANLNIERYNKSNDLIFSNIYTKESSANSKDTLTISMNGKSINGVLIKSRNKLDNGKIEIVLEELGIDGNDNKQAILRQTYIFNKTTFVKRKEVKFLDKNEWIIRYEYSYEKKHSR